jgi:hypothetical protein
MGGFELLVCVKSNRTHTRSSTDYSIRTKSGHVLPLYPDAFFSRYGVLFGQSNLILTFIVVIKKPSTYARFFIAS